MSEEKKNENPLDIESLNDELEQSMETARLNNSDEASQQKRKHHSKKKVRRAPKKGGAKKVLGVILGILILLIVLGAGSIFAMRMIGEKNIKEEKTDETITAIEGAEAEDNGKIVVYNGEKYRYNEDVISILFMGVDTSIETTGDDTIGENGQADTLLLAVMDTVTGDISLINISRDSMVDVNQYNFEGNYLGTEKMQLCLAYSYGDGKELSCENTMRSVSRLMYGMPINGYMAIDYNAISILNDAIGGVTVNVLEDLTAIDSELVQGNDVTLKGEQAHTYVRYRDTSQLASNNARMERQRQYLSAFIAKTLADSKKDVTLPLTLYRAADDDMVTDISASQVTYLASQVIQKGFSMDDMHNVEGEVVEGEKYAEFVPDETKLYELILDVFYDKTK